MTEKAYLVFSRSCTRTSESRLDTAGSVLNGLKTGGGKKDELVMKVQFNPGELRFDTGNVEKRAKKDLQEKKENIPGAEIKYEIIKGIRLSMRLIFVGDEEKSDSGGIRKMTEGLMACAAKSSEGLETAFCWGSFRFSGMLEEVSAEYIMFDEAGEPVQAEAELTICCDDSQEIRKLTEESYSKLFF